MGDYNGKAKSRKNKYAYVKSRLFTSKAEDAFTVEMLDEFFSYVDKSGLTKAITNVIIGLSRDRIQLKDVLEEFRMRLGASPSAPLPDDCPRAKEELAESDERIINLIREMGELMDEFESLLAAEREECSETGFTETIYATQAQNLYNTFLNLDVI